MDALEASTVSAPSCSTTTGSILLIGCVQKGMKNWIPVSVGPTGLLP